MGGYGWLQVDMGVFWWLRVVVDGSVVVTVGTGGFGWSWVIIGW